jgi:quercetin dioxygenase-like cupin family protein
MWIRNLETAVPEVRPVEGVVPTKGYVPVRAAGSAAPMPGRGKGRGRREVVFSSVFHPSIGAIVNHAAKQPVEEAVYTSGMDFTVLQPAMFMQNLVGAVGAARETGQFAMPYSKHAKVCWVDYRDVAEAVALAFTTSELSRGTFELCSPGLVDRIEMAAMRSGAGGRPVEATDVPRDRWSAQLPGALMREGLTRMMAHYDAYGVPGGNAVVLRAALGREPSPSSSSSTRYSHGDRGPGAGAGRRPRWRARAGRACRPDGRPRRRPCRRRRRARLRPRPARRSARRDRPALWNRPKEPVMSAPIPPDDRTRELAIAHPDDPALTHMAVYVGDTYTILLCGAQTAGRYALIDMLIPPGGGPPPHRHDFEEMFHVLEGTVEVTLRGATTTASAGYTVNVPANAPHNFTNASREPARLLCLVTPAGLEGYFAEFGDPVSSRTASAPDLTDEERQQRMQRAMERAPHYRIEILVGGDDAAN